MTAEYNTAERLNGLLANYSVYYQKVRNYHWNVRGPQFFQLHMKFEELYNQVALWVDGLAERVSALGHRPYSTLGEYLEFSKIQESREVPQATAMVANLAEDIDLLNAQTASVLALIAESDDVPTRTLLEDMIQQQATNHWMLSSFLES